MPASLKATEICHKIKKLDLKSALSLDINMYPVAFSDGPKILAKSIVYS